MKLGEHFKSRMVMIHAWKSREGTNNTVFSNAVRTPMDDQKWVFDEELKLSLDLPSHINSFYDQKVRSGAYERLWDLTVISLCSDIEYFFKDLLTRLKPQNKYKFGFYQRVNEVVDELIHIGFDLTDVKSEIQSLIECFQVRHIATHNMGFIDSEFLVKTGLEFSINEKFLIDQDRYKRYYESYWAVLKCIDVQLNH